MILNLILIIVILLLQTLNHKIILLVLNNAQFFRIKRNLLGVDVEILSGKVRDVFESKRLQRLTKPIGASFFELISLDLQIIRKAIILTLF